jgi:hypothetical protein
MWDDMGLLYNSGELSEKERQSFSEHLKQCSECSHEVEQYQREKEQFFTIDILGDLPSAACDAEILRVCSDGRKKTTGFNIVSLFIKKSVISMTLLIFGFIAVSSLVVLMESRNNGTTTAISSEATSEQKVASNDSEAVQNEVKDDSVSADSSQKSKVNFANTRGNLDAHGVYPVDLQNK